MFYRRYGSGEVDDVVDEKRGEMGFGIVDDGEFCCIIISDGELFGVVDNGIVVSDDFRGRVKDFDSGE